MNSLRVIPRKALPLARSRLFSTSPLARKSAVDQAKDTVKSVDQTISNAAVKGIEKGGQALGVFVCAFADEFETAERAAANAKSSIGLGASKAEGQASEMAGEAKGKAHEMSGAAQGKAQEMTGGDASQMAGEAKGKASELAGEAKGKAQETMGAAKGKAEEVKSKM
ncbi:MAG: hypothetical protein Q9183_007587 [Haloplaca sp. 2 TL-2023]